MKPIPLRAQLILGLIPERFQDDGCSGAPDSMFFGYYQFGWCCRTHDWRYCSRAHPAVEMTQEYRHMADFELARNIRSALPWLLRWLTSRVYYAMVDMHGGDEAWNSCGPEVGALCRHNMPPSDWMKRTRRKT